MQHQYSKNTHDVTKCSEGTRSCGRGAPKRAGWLCFHPAHSALALFTVDCSLYDWLTATNYSARPVHYSRRFLSPPPGSLLPRPASSKPIDFEFGYVTALSIVVLGVPMAVLRSSTSLTLPSARHSPAGLPTLCADYPLDPRAF